MQNQNNIAMTKLTAEEYNKFFRNKKNVYEHCLRTGFYLPSQTIHRCTEEWLTSVSDGKPFALDLKKSGANLVLVLLLLIKVFCWKSFGFSSPSTACKCLASMRRSIASIRGGC